MFGASGAQNQQEQRLGTLSPGWAMITNLLGMPTEVYKGGLQFGEGGMPDFTGPGGLLSRIGFNTEDALGAVTGSPQVDLPQTYQTLQNAVGSIADLARTGGYDQEVDLNRTMLRNELIPEIQETLGVNLGLNAGDSDTKAQLIRTIAQQSAQSGIRATDRMNQAALALPGLTGNLMQFEGAGRNILGQRDPSKQIMNTLTGIMGLNAQAGGVGESSGSKSAWNFGLPNIQS